MEEVKSLKEVSEDINEEIGKPKKFTPENGYFKVNLRGTAKEIELAEGKIRANLNFKGTKQPISFGYFKSKKGYNSRYKNNKEFADYYGEYIAYIILKQLGKKACKVDIGTLQTTNPYSGKPIIVEGTLSHYQLSQEEIFVPISVIVQRFKNKRPKKYRDLTPRGRTDSEKNHTNVELILEALEFTLKDNGQEEKIPEVRKRFFDMCAFDLRFANRDRHDDNFGVKINQTTGEVNFYHLFDNEQILGFQENRVNVEKYLSNPKEYEKFKKRELTSCIGIPGEMQQINPMDFYSYLLEHYNREISDSMEDIGRYRITHLNELMDKCDGLSETHKEFARKIFMERQIELGATAKAHNIIHDEER